MVEKEARMGITTKDIARMCGVSRTTVDRALKGRGRINPKTKEQILSVAQERGYRPDLLARSLITGKTMHIGVIVFDIRNYYFAEMLNNIENRAYEKGYFVNINLQEESKEKEIHLITSMVDRRVDGIILCPVNKGPEFEKFLLSLPMPVVVIGNYISERIPFVGIDESKAAFEAVDILVKKGYKKIIFVCPPYINRGMENLYTHERRVSGFKERIALETGIESAVVTGNDYINTLRSILVNNKQRTAVFCSGDIYALAIIKCLHEWNMKIPQDIGIMGFDNIPILEYIYPPLSTISNSVDKVAGTAVDNLIKLMNNEEPEKKVIFEHRIISGLTI